MNSFNDVLAEALKKSKSDGILHLRVDDYKLDIDCNSNSVLTAILPEIRLVREIYMDSMRGEIKGIKMSQKLDEDAAILLGITSAMAVVTGSNEVSIPVEETYEAMEILKWLFGAVNDDG